MAKSKATKKQKQEKTREKKKESKAENEKKRVYLGRLDGSAPMPKFSPGAKITVRVVDRRTGLPLIPDEDDKKEQ